jgi:hypothetical protein
MPAPKAGELVRASNYPKVRVIKKAANESVTSSTTVQNDDDFSVSLEAEKIYAIDLYLTVSGAAAGDYKGQWAVTGGVVGYTSKMCLGPESGTASVSATLVFARSVGVTSPVTYGVDGTNNSMISEHFLAETTTAGTAGTLTLQWAQGTSSATATIVGSGSYMVITEVDEI